MSKNYRPQPGIAGTMPDRYASLAGQSNILFWNKNFKDLVSEINLPGATLKYKGSSYTVKAPVFNDVSDAYFPTTPSTHKKNWKPIVRGEIVSLGTLTYENRFGSPTFPGNDFGGVSDGRGATFDLQISNPVKAKLQGNFTYNIVNRQNGPETISFGFPGSAFTDHNRYQFIINGRNQSGTNVNQAGSIYMDLLGARRIGTKEPLQFAFDVPDNTTQEYELFARVYTTDEAIDRGTMKVWTVPGRTSGSWVLKVIPTNIQSVGSVPKDVEGDYGTYATFKPAYNLTLDQAAKLSGYDHFNWYQKIIYDVDSRHYKGVAVTDPIASATSWWDDDLPYYLNEKIDPAWKHGEEATDRHYLWNTDYRPVRGSVPDYSIWRISQDGKTLKFSDAPQNKLYEDSSSLNLKEIRTSEPYPITYKIPDKSIAFQTYLVGVLGKNSRESIAHYRFDWGSNHYLGKDITTLFNKEGGNPYVLGKRVPIDAGFYAPDFQPHKASQARVASVDALTGMTAEAPLVAPTSSSPSALVSPRPVEKSGRDSGVLQDSFTNYTTSLGNGHVSHPSEMMQSVFPAPLPGLFEDASGIGNPYFSS
ncbi:hypothetical protein NIES2100_68740 [Calothrix sp. NIES-2100]|nr:hypothetical protein NIES2100_68740 [Calothrix sp. NIES-2100]